MISQFSILYGLLMCNVVIVFKCAVPKTTAIYNALSIVMNIQVQFTALIDKNNFKIHAHKESQFHYVL